jgi:muconolactone D-isomerase
LFRAADEAELHKILASLPLHIWMKVTITPLTPHPNDPENRAPQA